MTASKNAARSPAKPRGEELAAASPAPSTAKPPSPADALKWQAEAEVKRARAQEMIDEGLGTSAVPELLEAAALEKRADHALDVITHMTGRPMLGNGNEVAVPAGVSTSPGVINTIRSHPGMVTAQASHDRLALTGDAILLAADAANTINARNSLEKMLAHQLAVSHRLGMKFMEKADVLLQRFDLRLGAFHPAHEAQWASVEAARLANASARMMTVFQDGLLTLDRIRRGGKQTVKVIHQYVNVGPGGQAVVAGDMKAGGKGRRGKKRK
jgi:hypothetical protein